MSDDHPQENQPELQHHNGQVVLPHHIEAVSCALCRHFYDVLCDVNDMERDIDSISALSRAERKAAIQDFKTLAIYLRKFSLPSGIAGENQMPPNLEDFIPGKFLPDVIEVYVNNDFLYRVFGSRDFLDQSTTRRTIKFVRQYPQRTVIDEGVDGLDHDALNKLSTGQLDLRCSQSLGVGHHSEIFLAPFMFPSTTPGSTVHGAVAVKLSKTWAEAREMLLNEAKIYNAFPRHLHRRDIPVVPKFYGYYVPHTEIFDRLDNDNGSGDSDKEKCKRGKLPKYIAPILLLEACGRAVRGSTLLNSERIAIGRLLKRLHKANFIQGSTYERNVLVQPGPLNLPPADRSFSKPSYRIIDFGRGLGLGVNRSSLQDIKSEVETEQSYARDERLIPSGRKRRECCTDLRDLVCAAKILTDVIHALGRPSALPPPPLPPPAPTPSALHGATAAGRFLEHIKKSKECNVWLLDDKVHRVLQRLNGPSVTMWLSDVGDKYLL